MLSFTLFISLDGEPEIQICVIVLMSKKFPEESQSVYNFHVLNLFNLVFFIRALAYFWMQGEKKNILSILGEPASVKDDKIV